MSGTGVQSQYFSEPESASESATAPAAAKLADRFREKAAQHRQAGDHALQSGITAVLRGSELRDRDSDDELGTEEDDEELEDDEDSDWSDDGKAGRKKGRAGGWGGVASHASGGGRARAAAARGRGRTSRGEQRPPGPQNARAAASQDAGRGNESGNSSEEEPASGGWGGGCARAAAAPRGRGVTGRGEQPRAQNARADASPKEGDAGRGLTVNGNSSEEEPMRATLSFKGHGGGDHRFALLITACIQTALVETSTGKSINMWSDARGAKQMGKRNVADKIAHDLNNSESVFKKSLTADKVLDQFQAALKSVMQLRNNDSMRISAAREKALWDLDSMDQLQRRKNPAERKREARTNVRMMGSRTSREAPKRKRMQEMEEEEEEHWAQAQQEDRDDGRKKKRMQEDDDGQTRRKRRSSGAFERMQDESTSSVDVVKALLAGAGRPTAGASTFSYSNTDVEQVTALIDKVLEDASTKHGKAVETDLEALNAHLHNNLSQVPSLIGRVKTWISNQSNKDPGDLLMTVAIRCQTLVQADKKGPEHSAQSQWPKLYKCVHPV